MIAVGCVMSRSQRLFLRLEGIAATVLTDQLRDLGLVVVSFGSY
jgi:hypothetical protein